MGYLLFIGGSFSIGIILGILEADVKISIATVISLVATWAGVLLIYA